MSSTNFVKVDGTTLVRDGKPFRVVGTNFWHGINMGAIEEWGGDRKRLDAELDELKSLGVNMLRIMASSEGEGDEPFRMKPCLMTKPGEYNEEIFRGLDYFLDALAKRGFTAIVTLTNQWHWSGGFAQYVAWASDDKEVQYPPSWDPVAKAYTTAGSFDDFAKYGCRFYNDETIRGKIDTMFKDNIKTIVSRRNTINGTLYSEDSSILAWELCNEPQFPPAWWVDDVAGYIRNLGVSQLITSGIETKYDHVDFTNSHASSNIDFCTSHFWCENWEIYDPEDKTTASLEKTKQAVTEFIHKVTNWAQELGKPHIMEEFGMARDAHLGAKYSEKTTTTHRDEYFATIFKVAEELAEQGKMTGTSFWAWGGQASESAEPNQYGVKHIGDPPHETPFWYSVLSSDTTTKDIIKSHAERML
ncbi:hypothetical protein K450DRAFT_174240 [Umbelopsis ramanniana AG]|uniref:mannan endo-1,4-beta-mannosidase n=1 Tax=Umbelopsis ramanniana AG TaxID=1314678 RepID=A0AAD5ECW7_UMBRA|nr:uncharacterized protein K450DRAFT_174240 [Umbelopsis ramanniana AG]KAI8579925.1 hypothetical protein K450DRAFT_174240 [Umbelopsis ramanniana AG]